MAENVVLNLNINTANALKGIGQLNGAASTTLSTINDMELASAALNEQLRNTEIGTQAFKDLSSQLNVVNTELKNAELNLEVLDNEQMVGSVKGLAGGLTDVAGGLALIGVSGDGIEKIAETFAKVEGISKVIGGSLDVYNEGLKVTRALTVAATAAANANALATTAQGNASTATTVKMRILNLVMKANPVLLLVAGVTALVGALYLLGSSSASATEDLEKLQSSIELTNASFSRQAQFMDANAKAEVLRAKLRGDSEAEIARIEKEAVELAALTESRRLSNLIQTNKKIIRNSESTAEEKAKARAENLQYEFEQQQAYFTAETLATLEYNYKIKIINEKNNEEKQKLNEKFYNDQLSNSKRLQELATNLSNDQELNDAEEIDRIGIVEAREIEAAKNIYNISLRSEQDKQNLEIATQAIRNKANDQRVIMVKESLRLIEEAERETAIRIQQQRYEDLNEIEAAEDEIRRRFGDQKENEINDVRDYYFRLIELAKQNGEDTLVFEMAQGSEIERINREFRDKEKEAIKALILENIELYSQYTDKVAEIFGSVNDIISELSDRQLEKTTESIQTNLSVVQDALDTQLANRILSEEEYEVKSQRLKDEAEAKERQARQKAFKDSKRLAIIQANISGAQAVLAAISSGMAVPLIGPATAAVYASIAGVLSAVQIGVIASQEFRAAKGGVVPGNGPGHIDSVPALLAPGEMVINSNSSRMFGGLLSSINEAGGGIPLINGGSGNNPITQAMNGGNQTSNIQVEVQANVLETGVTKAQTRMNRIKRNKEFFSSN